MKAPIYRGVPVESLERLVAIQDMTVPALMKLIRQPSRYYRANKPVPKDNGSVRQHYTVSPPLKQFQRCIVDNIFHKVEFPDYLQGSIKADGVPRGYIENAMLHAPYRFIVRDDIKDFFPSIRVGLVFSVWRDFFGFPNDVARALTRVTTYQGCLPQGAATSSYIANLVFWDIEYRLVAMLEQHGYVYSRFVDDINVSTNTPLDESAVTFVREQVYGMLRSRGFRPNRRKGRVQTRSSKKTVHRLNISSGRPTMDKKERSRIRAAVKRCEDLAKLDQSSEAYLKLYRSTLGRVENMGRIHQRVAESYRNRLFAIQPLRGN